LSPKDKAVHQDLRRDLKEAQRPILLGGIDVLGVSGVAALLQAAEALSLPARTCGASLALAGPNSFGNALLAESGPDFDAILSDIESGAVRALVCLQTDPLSEHPDPRRVEAALARLELLAVLDCLPTRTVERARAFLPTAATAEMDGTFVNQEGRLLAYRRVFAAGLPIRVTGNGDHPPRTFLPETPGNQPRPDWAALCAILERDADLPALRAEIEKTDPRFAGLTPLTAEDPGCRVILDRSGPLPAAPPPSLPGPGLSLLVTESLFGSEPLSSCSAPVAAAAPAPVLRLNAAEAGELDLVEGEQAVLSGDFGELRLPVRLEPDQARGLAVVARLRGTITGGLVPGGGFSAVRVRKGGGR
jgi:NADH-quinone oxidoreductase subunit G